jgi:hypothetical protein
MGSRSRRLWLGNRSDGKALEKLEINSRGAKDLVSGDPDGTVERHRHDQCAGPGAAKPAAIKGWEFGGTGGPGAKCDR